MKKLISLVICLFMLCTLCVPVFAENQSPHTLEKVMNDAKNMVALAKSYKDSMDYTNAAMYYHAAASRFTIFHEYYELAAYAFGLAADAYEEDDQEFNANATRDSQKQYAELAKTISNCVKVDEVFNGDDIKSTGSVLSEGSLTVIVGVACLAVGFLAAMFIFKKKKPAVADGAENIDKE